MSFTLNAIFSLSIVLSVLIGWIRFRRTDPAFLPILLLVTLAALNEVISLITSYYYHNNVNNFNAFQLIEALLLTWQFLKWGLFEGNKGFYYLLQGVFAGIWVTENILLRGEFSSYFVIAHSFIIVILSINQINKVAMKESTSVFKHPVALICIALITYFTYAILIETFWLVGFYNQRQFRLKIFEILSYINLVTNLLFAYAFLWIPMRPQYIMQS
jgi:hypothetical protein